MTKAVLIILLSYILSSCNVNQNINTPVEMVVETPQTYEFMRNGKSTVSFLGQTTRLQMVNEIGGKFKEITTTVADFTRLFEDGKGFSEDVLNESEKNLISKVGETVVDQTVVQKDFVNYYTKQVHEVFPNWEVPVTKGTSGYFLDGTAIRYVNAKGLEYNQVFYKGLIGALVADQSLNDYLEKILTDSNELVEGQVYTDMEHHFDEAYGYVYGNKENDVLMYKYINKVDADSDFAGIANNIENAFKLGRAAIVAKKYELRDEQISIIRKALSKVIAVRAVYYLQNGRSNVGATESFHDLSEGYGFIYALQFTHNPKTGNPYFTRSEVMAYLNKLDAEDGFWSLSTDTLDDISDDIANAFGFTVEQAAN